MSVLYRYCLVRALQAYREQAHKDINGRATSYILYETKRKREKIIYGRDETYRVIV